MLLVPLRRPANTCSFARFSSDQSVLTQFDWRRKQARRWRRWCRPISHSRSDKIGSRSWSGGLSCGRTRAGSDLLISDAAQPIRVESRTINHRCATLASSRLPLSAINYLVSLWPERAKPSRATNLAERIGWRRCEQQVSDAAAWRAPKRRLASNDLGGLGRQRPRAANGHGESLANG